MNANTIQEGTKTPTLITLAIFVGIIGGFGALVFRALIGFIHNLLFQGQFNFFYNANIHPLPSIWGIGFILVPVIGGLAVTWLTQTFAPEASGHGVPEVMNAIYYQDGKIRPIVAIIKAIASAISIGSAGSVGREGPIIQIGSAFGSALGQFTHLSTRQRNILIAAGAAAGIAATFNAPLGGITFAIELMMVSINAINVTLVTISTVIATAIGRLFLGVIPSFNVPNLRVPSVETIPWHTLILFIPFGIFIGILSAIFIRSIYSAEDVFQKISNPYLRTIVGTSILGVLLYLTMKYTNHYYIDGVGYSTILDILRNTITNPWFLLLLGVMKLLATSLTLGSGASGGVFSPSLFIGASFGSAFGYGINYLMPGLHLHPTLFIIAGMAGMVGGSTGAVITASVMLFEQTRDYHDILPMMITVALAYAVRIKITAESIYTLKLARRGHVLPQGLQANIVASRRAKDIIEKDFTIIDQAEFENYKTQPPHSCKPYSIAHENNNVIGFIDYHGDYLVVNPDESSSENRKIHFVHELTPWPVVLRKMKKNMDDIVIVVNKPFSQHINSVVGVITEHEIAKAARQTVELV